MNGQEPRFGLELKTQPPPQRPVMGYLAVGCGILGLFTHSLFFVPLAFLFSVVALFMGQALWAFAGLTLSFIGLVTSPVLLAFLGLGALAAYFGLTG